jgi:hypothetical protein
MRRSHHPNSRRGARPWATRLATLLAVFLQAFIVQTHVHAIAPLATAGYERAADEVPVATLENAAHQEVQAACALCQAQAAGRALSPTSQAIAVENGRNTVEPATDVRRVSVAASHSWRSRAPPAHL